LVRRHRRLAPERHVDDRPRRLLVQPPHDVRERLVVAVAASARGGVVVVVGHLVGQEEAGGDDGLGEEIRQQREQPRLRLGAAAEDDETAAGALHLVEPVHVRHAGGVLPEHRGDRLGFVPPVRHGGGERDPRWLHHVVLRRRPWVRLVLMPRAQERQDRRRQDEEDGARDLTVKEARKE